MASERRQNLGGAVRSVEESTHQNQTSSKPWPHNGSLHKTTEYLRRCSAVLGYFLSLKYKRTLHPILDKQRHESLDARQRQTPSYGTLSPRARHRGNERCRPNMQVQCLVAQRSSDSRQENPEC